MSVMNKKQQTTNNKLLNNWEKKSAEHQKQYKNFLQTNIAAIKALKHEAQYYLTKRFVHKDLRAGLFFLRPETETEIITLIDRLRMLLEEPFPSPEELNNALNKINTLLSENQFEVWNIPPIDENGYSKTLTLKGLTRLTAEFLALPNIHLVQNIDLHLSHLRQLPPSFSLFTHLKTLDLKNNPLSEFPMVLLQAPFTTSLEDLNISFTKIREIPAEISALGGILDKLSFSGNSVNIAVLPETLLKLKPSGVAAFTSRAIQFNSTESAFSSGENDSSVSKTHLVSMGHRVNKKEIPENRNPMTGTSEPQSEESARKRIRRI